MDPVVNHETFIDWIVKFLVTAAFLSWAWIVRKFGNDYIASVNRIESKLDTVVKEFVELKIRIAVLERSKELTKE